MTAINIVRTPHSVHICTDSAAFDDDGIIQWFGPKAVTFPHMNAALMVGGDAHILFELARQIEKRAPTFEDLVSSNAMTESVMNLYERSYNPLDAVIIVAGWSNTRRAPEVYIWKSGKPPQMELFVPPILIAPGVPLAEREAAGIVLRTDAGERKIGRALVAIAEMQRRLPEKFSRVGGCLQFTTINEDGISQRILHRWNDRVGEPIRLEEKKTNA